MTHAWNTGVRLNVSWNLITMIFRQRNEIQIFYVAFLNSIEYFVQRLHSNRLTLPPNELFWLNTTVSLPHLGNLLFLESVQILRIWKYQTIQMCSFVWADHWCLLAQFLNRYKLQHLNYDNLILKQYPLLFLQFNMIDGQLNILYLLHTCLVKWNQFFNIFIEVFYFFTCSKNLERMVFPSFYY